MDDMYPSLDCSELLPWLLVTLRSICCGCCFIPVYQRPDVISARFDRVLLIYSYKSSGRYIVWVRESEIRYMM